MKYMSLKRLIFIKTMTGRATKEMKRIRHPTNPYNLENSRL